MTAPIPTITLAPVRFVTIDLAATLTGLTAKAIRRKIERGSWLEGRQYKRQDGGVYVDLRAYEAWVMGKR